MVIFKRKGIKDAHSNIAERLPDRSEKPAEAFVCKAFVADLQRIAGYVADNSNKSRLRIALKV